MRATIARLFAVIIIIKASISLIDKLVNIPYYPMLGLEMLVSAITIFAVCFMIYGIRDEDKFGMIPIIITLFFAMFLV